MYYPNNLLDYLRNDGSVIGLDKPDITLWVENGTIINYPASDNENFISEYTITLLIQEYHGNASSLFLFINRWYAQNQPQQIHNNRIIRFSVDINNTSSVDLLVEIPIEEINMVKQSKNGATIETLVQSPAAFLGEGE